jgi:hypothetical protein
MSLPTDAIVPARAAGSQLINPRMIFCDFQRNAVPIFAIFSANVAEAHPAISPRNRRPVADGA